MPTVLDKIARPLANKMIAQFGALVTITKVTPGAYDPNTSAATPTEVAETVRALVEDYNLVDSGAGFAAGLITFGDKKITVAATAITFEPTAGDKITYNSEVFTVMRVLKTYSGEQVAIYEIQARA